MLKNAENDVYKEDIESNIIYNNEKILGRPNFAPTFPGA